MLINDSEEFNPPYPPGTVLVLEKSEGRYIRLNSLEEINLLIETLLHIKENFNASS